MLGLLLSNNAPLLKGVLLTSLALAAGCSSYEEQRRFTEKHGGFAPTEAEWDNTQGRVEGSRLGQQAMHRDYQADTNKTLDRIYGTGAASD